MPFGLHFGHLYPWIPQVKAIQPLAWFMLWAWVATIGCWRILKAEQGRRFDLRKRHYPLELPDYRLEIIVPVTATRYFECVPRLLATLAQQQYTFRYFRVHVVSIQGLDQPTNWQQDSTHPFLLEHWQYPDPMGTAGEATAWLLDRLLARSEQNRLFVFLAACDVVKPDFLTHIVQELTTANVIQGFVAHRGPDGFRSPLLWLSESLEQWSTRLFNRVGQPSAYHAGNNVLLGETGWAIQQELLERIPYIRNWSEDNADYTQRLTAAKERIRWAPQVVVYTQPTQEHRSSLARGVHRVAHVLNRLKLARHNLQWLRPSYPLLWHAAMAFSAINLWLALTLAPELRLMASAWILLLAFLGLLAMTIARSSLADILLGFLGWPTHILFSVLLLPLVIIQYLWVLWLKARHQVPGVAASSRFYDPSSALGSALASSQQTDLNSSLDALLQPDLLATQQTAILVKQGKQLHCTLQLQPHADHRYSIKFSYKQQQYMSQAHHYAEQAYYEVFSRLQNYGLQLQSCGSCQHYVQQHCHSPKQEPHQPAVLPITSPCQHYVAKPL